MSAPPNIKCLDADNRRFVAALLRLHLESKTMPPGWAFADFRDVCVALGVAKIAAPNGTSSR